MLRHLAFLVLAAHLVHDGVELTGDGIARRSYDVLDPRAAVVELPLVGGRIVDHDLADGTDYVYALGGQRLHVSTPPRALPTSTRPAIWIDKAHYTLAVVAAGKVLKRYPIALGRLPQHRKLAFDNASTPEGLYHIQAAQFHAKFYRAFDLDYPNSMDRVRYALERPPTPIGGEIQIHGRGIDRNWTYGCIALRDADMNELFAHPEIGRGTEVRIWGGELQEADLKALEGTHAAYRKALPGWDGEEGPSFWQALGRFQRAHGKPVSCVPDAATRAALKL